MFRAMQPYAPGKHPAGKDADVHAGRCRRWSANLCSRVRKLLHFAKGFLRSSENSSQLAMNVCIEFNLARKKALPDACQSSAPRPGQLATTEGFCARQK